MRLIFDSVNLTLIVFEQGSGGQAEAEFGSAQAEPVASENAEGRSSFAHNCELTDRLLG
jgi:hypothetical protein